MTTNDYLMTIRWLSNDYLMNIRWLSDDYPMTIRWLSDDYPMTIHWLSNDYPMTITNFRSIFLIIFDLKRSMDQRRSFKCSFHSIGLEKIRRIDFYETSWCSFLQHKYNAMKAPLLCTCSSILSDIRRGESAKPETLKLQNNTEALIQISMDYKKKRSKIENLQYLD